MTIILSLVLTLIEGARVYAVRMQAECVVRTAMDSCLAEYNRELESRYNLFYVDASYRSGSAAESNVTSHMEDYLNQNLETSTLSSILGTRDLTAMSVSSCEITDTRYACDSHGQSVREQIEAYMTAGPEAAVVSGIVDQFSAYMEIDEDSWPNAFDDASSEFEDAVNDYEEDEDDEEHEDHQESKDRLGVIEDILDEIHEVIASSFLIQVFGVSGDISIAGTEGSDLIEDRSIHYGSSYEAENSHDYSEVGSLLMGQYILEKCSNYREQVDGCVLDYEAEYIVFGERTDRRNLERMTERLVLIRAAVDLVAIHGVTSCTSTADVVAGLLELLGIPAPVTRELILVIWSYAEAIQDVKTLYRGGKVPLVKSGSNWQTSWESLLSIGSGDGSSGGSGLDYAMYLRLFLLSEDMFNKDEVTERLMNVMELDVTKAQDGTPLYMDWCMDAMKADVTITSGYGYEAHVIQEITYN